MTEANRLHCMATRSTYSEAQDRRDSSAVGELASGALIGATEPLRERIGAQLDGLGVRILSFDTTEELVAASPEPAPSLILLWLESVDSSLGKQVEPLLKQFEHSALLLLCAEIQRWEMRSVLSSGVAGVVLEKEIESALGPCARAVLADQVCVPKQHWRQIEPPVLSGREKQILGLVVMGYMNGQIAEQLFLAESTIKSHLSSAFTKLGVRSRNEAVELILNSERGLGMGILALGGEQLRAAGISGAEGPPSYGPIEISDGPAIGRS